MRASGAQVSGPSRLFLWGGQEQRHKIEKNVNKKISHYILSKYTYISTNMPITSVCSAKHS